MTTTQAHVSSPVRAPQAARPALEPRAGEGQPVSSSALLAGASTLIIEHMGMQYILRATRNGKLILTK
jgi:hemin uptake protein HemP